MKKLIILLIITLFLSCCNKSKSVFFTFTFDSEHYWQNTGGNGFIFNENSFNGYDFEGGSSGRIGTYQNPSSMTNPPPNTFISEEYLTTKGSFVSFSSTQTHGGTSTSNNFCKIIATINNKEYLVRHIYSNEGSVNWTVP